jgi:hypothetical protein
MSDDNRKIFQYIRGPKDKPEYSVNVVVTNNDSLFFHNFHFPIEATSILKEKFIEEAETAALKQIEKNYTEDEEALADFFGGVYGASNYTGE